MVGTRIHRVTLFKVPDLENQKKLLEAYAQLSRDQFKDGKPYIIYLCAGAVTTPSELAQGFTVVAKTEFASEEDMRYYDDECPAHAALKKKAPILGLSEKPLVLYFTGSPLII